MTNTFLALFLTHLASTALGLALHRRLFANRAFHFPHTVGAALRDPAFRALLGLGIILPYVAGVVANTLLVGLTYAQDRYTWVLAIHTGLSILYYRAGLRATARRNRP
ncbi:hypothetical protein [Hymenobacter psychrotolerans]|uniref:Uncharacterized protein n=1 Tax=Hymenobacter psychrotolerans DSM 18569 TaxID=1121959 RepID=A0A1M6VFN7_9BACT|nr:hypothetical protein [Hymenobacter psychrotolerans]SHK80174.1 hypothetical protein SAMN02746009_01590 [Hymenobacter psychrotolerans DSM 18569]